MKRLRTLAIFVAAIIAALGVIVAYQRPIASEPADHNMTLTIPAIGVDEVPVHTGPVTDEAGLRNGVLHVRGTGFPWERDANIYIAGHDLGFPATPSDKVFWNLRTLQDGDKIYLTDANGTRYTYTVYNKFIIKPTAVR